MAQYTLPDWARNNAKPVDFRTNPYFGAQDVGSGSGTLGGGDGRGFYAPLERFAGNEGSGENMLGARGFDLAGAEEFLRSSGSQLFQAAGGNNEVARWMQDAQGNIIAEPEISSLDDDNFWTAALLAAAVTGANVYAASSAGGGVASLPGGATEAGGAVTSPVSPGTVTSMPLSGSAAAGGTATSGTAGGAVSSAFDPVASYLTTGASEGSTVGNFLSGAGGSSGAVGAGSSASWLQSLGSGASDLFAKGGVKSIFDIASGIYGMNLASDARKASDPFSPYRGAYAEQLSQLEANPGAIVNRPGFQAGLLAIDRSAAAKGYTGSGNAMSSLQRFGSDFYNQEAQRLAGLAGANQTPGAGQFPAAQLTSQSLASLGYGLAPYLSGGPR